MTVLHRLTWGLTTAVLAALLALATTPPASAQNLNPKKMEKLRYWAERLDIELEHLVEDVAATVPRQHHNLIYQHANHVLKEVHHFRKTLNSGDVNHIYNDFARMDKEVHELMKTIDVVGRDSYALNKGLERVHNADQQLHYLLTQGNAGKWKDAVARQAHLLEKEGASLLHTLSHFAPQGPDGQKLRAAVTRFVKQAQHFHHTAEEHPNKAHMVTDFREVDQTWHQIVDLLNHSWQGQHFYIRNVAGRVNEIHNTLAQLIDAPGKRPVIHHHHDH